MNLALPDLQQPGPGLAQVLSGLARGIRSDIENLSTDTGTRIHDIRVSSKKIRSLLKLTRPAVPKDRRKQLAGLARQLKELFSGSRDEEVMRQRLRELWPEEEYDHVLSLLNFAQGESAGPFPLADAVAVADSLNQGIDQLDLTELTIQTAGKNAVRAYREARQLWTRCARDPDDVLMHDWRKRVKDAYYHADALSPAKFFRKRVEPLDALADSLGQYHDWAVLSARTAGHPATAKAIAAIKRRTARRCFRCAEKALEDSPTLFARKVRRALT